MRYCLIIMFICLCFSNCTNSSTVGNSEDNGKQKTSVLDSEASKRIDSSLPDMAVDTLNKDWLLVPGIAAGQTRIGENADSVFSRLGTPDGGDAAMQKAVAIWYAHHDTTGYSTAIYTARNTDSPSIARVLQIRITSPVFKTGKGIHTESLLAQIKKAFVIEQTEKYKEAGRQYTVYDSPAGIAFEMGSDDICVAIIIHKAGVTGESTYLKFRTTNKFISQKESQ